MVSRSIDKNLFNNRYFTLFREKWAVELNPRKEKSDDIVIAFVEKIAHSAIEILQNLSGILPY